MIKKCVSGGRDAPPPEAVPPLHRGAARQDAAAAVPRHVQTHRGQRGALHGPYEERLHRTPQGEFSVITRRSFYSFV